MIHVKAFLYLSLRLYSLYLRWAMGMNGRNWNGQYGGSSKVSPSLQIKELVSKVTTWSLLETLLSACTMAGPSRFQNIEFLALLKGKKQRLWY